MRGYQWAVVVLALILVVTTGVLFYVLADRSSLSDGNPKVESTPAVTTGTPATQYVIVRETEPAAEPAAEEEPAVCHHCGGGGYLPCGTCGGDGIMLYACPRCGGSGMVQPSPVDPMLVRCSDCGGDGELNVPCSTCGHDGTVTCSHCSGTGLEP